MAAHRQETGSDGLGILKTNIRTNDRKTNTKGFVSDKNNQNSSNRMNLTCLLRISLSFENNKSDSLITLFIGFATKNRMNMTPHHQIDLNSLVLRNLKAVLTRNRREHKI